MVQANAFTPKMVFGPNLHYMAPFAIPRTGFCMVFQRASFVFSCPGADFGAQDWILDPRIGFGSAGRHLGRGTLFGQFWGLEKSGSAMKLFCGGLAGESVLPK